MATVTATEADTLIEQLEVWQETRNPCEWDHVEHTAADHLGRRLVHTTTLHGFGADWEVAGAEEFIRAADYIGETGPGRYVWVRSDGRDVAFAVKRESQP